MDRCFQIGSLLIRSLAMSTLDHKENYGMSDQMSALPLKADIAGHSLDVR